MQLMLKKTNAQYFALLQSVQTNVVGFAVRIELNKQWLTRYMHNILLCSNHPRPKL